MVFAAIAGIIGLVASIGLGIASYNTQQQVNEANIQAQEDINNQNIEFAQKENEITREREDTAHQREVEDLKAAGLSPIANLSGAKSSSGITPQLQAPTQDASGMVEGLRMMQSGFDGLGDMAKTIYQESEQDERHQKQLDYMKLIEDNKLDQLMDQFNKTMDFNRDKLEQDDLHFQENLLHLKNVMKQDQTQFDARERQEMVKMEVQSVYDTVGAVKINYCSSQQEYKQLHNIVWEEIGDELAKFDLSVDEVLASSNSKGGFDAKLGSTDGKGLLGAIGGASGGLSTDSTKSSKATATAKVKETIRNIILKNGGYPVYSPRDDFKTSNTIKDSF